MSAHDFWCKAGDLWDEVKKLAAVLGVVVIVVVVVSALLGAF